MLKVIFSLLLILMFSGSSLSAQGFSYSSPEHGIRLSFPEGWSVDSHVNKTILAVAVAPDGESINIAVEKLPSEYSRFTFESFSLHDVKEYIKELESKLISASPGIVLEDWGTRKIDGKKAVWVLFSLPSPELGGIKTLHIQVMHNARLYMVTCGAASDKYRTFKRIFEQSLNSIRFELPGVNL